MPPKEIRGNLAKEIVDSLDALISKYEKHKLLSLAKVTKINGENIINLSEEFFFIYRESKNFEIYDYINDLKRAALGKPTNLELSYCSQREKNGQRYFIF